MSNIPDGSAELSCLEHRIQAITDLYNRIQTLRHVPTLLLKPAISNDLSSLLSLRSELNDLKDIGEHIRSEKVQEVLRAARDSEKADKNELSSSIRRENRKRRYVWWFVLLIKPTEHFWRRPPSPESPQPYASFQPKTASLFPITADEPPPLQVEGLADYIRNFNETKPYKLHVWTRTKVSTILSNPIIVRFTIRDVLTAFITLSYSDGNSVLITHTVTAFGPREQKSPHSQSDYTVYQNLSQQIAKMVQSHRRVSFQNLMNLLCSYSGLFVDRCTTCQRVLSIEGHVPPVSRIWLDSGTDKTGLWQPRHIICLHSWYLSVSIIKKDPEIIFNG